MNEKTSPAHLTDEEWFSLPGEVRVELYQPMLREVCTHLQNWRHCPLPRCRRARVCTGSHTLNRRNPSFPPCIRNGDEQGCLIAAINQLAQALEADCENLE